MKQWFNFWMIVLSLYLPVKENSMADKDWDNLADLIDGTRSI